MTESMIEKVARAIDSVQLFSRFDDWSSDRVEGLPIEICRYGKEGEDEIVVLRRFPAQYDALKALREVISYERARAAIEAMREPTRGMVEDGYAALMDWDARTGEDKGISDTWVAMIDAALNEEVSG